MEIQNKFLSESPATTPYLTLGQAAKLCPNRPSTNAVWRWCRKGVKSRSGERVHLEHVRVGRVIYTTHQWLKEHRQAVTQSDMGHFSQKSQTQSKINSKKKPQSDSQREKSIQKAEEILRIAKI